MQGWTQFPGGELEGLERLESVEGRRTSPLCPKCREERGASRRSTFGSVRRATLCFQCYRLGLERDRALGAAAGFESTTDARFQESLPFEPVNRARLARLRTEREAERRHAAATVHRFVDRRRHAQIEARHALDRLAQGLRSRAERTRAELEVLHAVNLQFPESWLPFIVRRRA
jgi:hypothetical protein